MPREDASTAYRRNRAAGHDSRPRRLPATRLEDRDFPAESFARLSVLATGYDGGVIYNIIDAMAERHIPITAVLVELHVSRSALSDPANRAKVIGRLEQRCPQWRTPGALELAFPTTFTPEVPLRE